MQLTAISHTRFGLLIAQACRWWIAELRSIVAMSGWSGRSRQINRILLSRDQVAVERVTAEGADRFVEHRNLDDLDEAGFAELAQLCGSETDVVLAPPYIHILNFVLPPAARSRLRAAVELDMWDQSPVRPELLSWEIIAQQADAAAIAVTVGLAHTARLKHIHDLLQVNNITVRDFRIEQGASTGRLPVPGRQQYLIDLDRYRVAIICACLLVSVPLTTWAAGAVLTVRTETAASGLRDSFLEARQVEREARKNEERKSLLAPLASQPGAATILNALATAIPSDDWLRSVQRHPDGSLSFDVVTDDEEALDKAVRDQAFFKAARVEDRAPGSEGSVDVTYRTDAP